MTTLKNEHVESLKEDFEQVCSDKVSLQVQIDELSEEVSKQQRKIDELSKQNDELGKKLVKEDEDDVMNLLDFTA